MATTQKFAKNTAVKFRRRNDVMAHGKVVKTEDMANGTWVFVNTGSFGTIKVRPSQLIRL
jgi:hypothetical protein